MSLVKKNENLVTWCYMYRYICEIGMKLNCILEYRKCGKEC